MSLWKKTKQHLFEFKSLAVNFLSRLYDDRASILVLHDIDGWALDHVFTLWFSQSRSFRVTRLSWNRIGSSRIFAGFNLVVFGYLDIYMRYNYSPQKSILVIHDPCEIFPQEQDWRDLPPLQDRIEILQSLRAVIVISEELEKILNAYKVKTYRISTMSRLPACRDCDLADKKPSAISIFKDYPRKNSALLKSLAEKGDLTGKWKLKLYENPDMSDEEYLELIDQTSIYVCCSWQEGGPLPAMDVMSRGGVVISTKVGQLQEIIIDSYSGFFCGSESEFEEKLSFLFSNHHSLSTMRRNSLKSYNEARSENAIIKSVNQTFEQIFES